LWLEYHAGLADKVGRRTISVPGNKLSLTLLEPLRVTAHIIPWNYPLLVMVRSVAPALALGNTVVAKPAEQTPLSALYFARLAEEAGNALATNSPSPAGRRGSATDSRDSVAASVRTDWYGYLDSVGLRAPLA
jgi:acyl-CoA reductase-like NAD-dependent aldehyde dehydrogenase